MSETPSTSNHARIAKNTLFLSLRQLLVMGIAFYTSRVILEALGVVDFGVYNVVAGVSFSMVFFSATLATSTQRFLSYEIALDNPARLRRVFSISFWTMCAVGALVIIVGGAIGPWLVYHVLNIPADRMDAALIVFYAMIVGMAIMLVFSVFEAVLIARENMKIYAFIGLSDACLKLAIAYIVMVSPERLITYGLLMVVALLLPKLIMLVYCRRHYPESLPERVWDRKGFRIFIHFVGWNIYEGLVWVINSEGINVLLNIFFGPVVNAARGITQQVNGAVVNFSTSFFMAVRPQIVKTYARKSFDEVRKLVSMGSRGSFFLIWILSVPILFRTDYILSLWLVEVPSAAPVFLRWTMVFLLVNCLQPPLAALTQATGELRRYMLISMNTYLAAFPVSVAVIWLGAPAWSVYPVLIVSRFVSNLIVLYTLRSYIVITLRNYMGRVVAPICAVVGCSLVCTWALSLLVPENFAGLVLYGIGSVVTTAGVIYILGMTRDEREAVGRRIRHVLRRK